VGRRVRTLKVANQHRDAHHRAQSRTSRQPHSRLVVMHDGR
jgi:hypothetical protein